MLRVYVCMCLWIHGSVYQYDWGCVFVQECEFVRIHVWGQLCIFKHISVDTRSGNVPSDKTHAYKLFIDFF